MPKFIDEGIFRWWLAETDISDIDSEEEMIEMILGDYINASVIESDECPSGYVPAEESFTKILKLKPFRVRLDNAYYVIEAAAKKLKEQLDLEVCDIDSSFMLRLMDICGWNSSSIRC